MSNLLKTGFQSFTDKNSEPFIIDVNSRKINTDSVKGRIIRPMEEKNESTQDENNSANEAILDDAFEKAKLLRDEAMVNAAQIIARANEEAETIREQARENGYNQGLEEGNMEAMKRADKYLENLQREQDEILQKNAEEFQRHLEETENDIVDIMCMLIEKLTGILVDDYKPVLLHMINNALGETESCRTFEIRVAEDCYDYISENKDRLLGASNPNISIDIFGDPKLNRRQCIIESENGIIDLSMDVQIKNLMTVIKLLT